MTWKECFANWPCSPTNIYRFSLSCLSTKVGLRIRFERKPILNHCSYGFIGPMPLCLQSKQFIRPSCSSGCLSLWLWVHVSCNTDGSSSFANNCRLSTCVCMFMILWQHFRFRRGHIVHFVPPLSLPALRAQLPSLIRFKLCTTPTLLTADATPGLCVTLTVTATVLPTADSQNRTIYKKITKYKNKWAEVYIIPLQIIILNILKDH